MDLFIKNRTYVENNHLYSKDKLSIRAFQSAQELKAEIRRIMRQRRAEHWDFCGLKTCGALISLCFRRSLDFAVSDHDDCACLQCA